jgi:hypothetical protein
MIYKLEYKIEKNIPIPEIQEFRFPLLEMEVGDSFFVPILDWVSMGLIAGRPAIWECLKKQSQIEKREYKIRTVRHGFRVWRTE